MADRRPGAPNGADPRDAQQDELLRAHHHRLSTAATPDPAFADELERSLFAPPSARARRRRWRLPAAAAAVMVAALVGGAIAGIIFRMREDETALVPSPSPEPTLITTSSDPSASAFPAVTLAPTGTPPPSQSAAATAAQTTAATVIPTPSASPPPAPAATPAPTPMPTPTPTPTATPSIAWAPVADSPDVYASIASSAVGSDGHLYTLFSDARVPNRGRQADVSPIIILDPTDDSVDVRMPAGALLGTDAQAAGGTDGLLYVFHWGADLTSVYAYDPATDAFVPDAEAELSMVAWDATLGGDGVIYLLATPNGAMAIHAYDPATKSVSLIVEAEHEGAALISDPEGNLVVVGDDGVWVYDLEEAAWRQLTDELPWGMSRRMAAAGPDGQIVVATSTGDVGYFDGVDWELLPVTREIGGVSFLDGRWMLLTVETAAFPGPTTVRYWESTDP